MLLFFRAQHTLASKLDGMGGACWEATYDACRPYSAFAGGIIFGAGWWIFGDALAYNSAMLNLPFHPLWLLPGIIATLAILLMNTVSPDDVSSDSYGYGDEAATCRSRVILLLSYALSMAAVCVSVALLLNEKKKEGADLWIGASSVIQVCLVCLSGLVTWVFHSSSGSDSGYRYI